MELDEGWGQEESCHLKKKKKLSLASANMIPFP